MPQPRRKFDDDFKAGAIRIVEETGRPVAEVARELGINDSTLHNWISRSKDRPRPGAVVESVHEENKRLRAENKELRMQRDVLKRSVVLWVDDAMGRKS